MNCEWCDQVVVDENSYRVKRAGQPDDFVLCEGCMTTAGATCESCLAILADEWEGGQCPDCGEIVAEDGQLEVLP